MRLISVKWLDHSGFRHWVEKEQLMSAKPVVIQSVGWLVQETEDYVTIAASEDTEGKFNDCNIIIRSCIQEMRNVRLSSNHKTPEKVVEEEPPHASKE